MDLRKKAKGQRCMVRIPPDPDTGKRCSGGGVDTVLAHYRLSGYCGTGMKPDDLAFGAWCCAQCHRWCDSVDQHSLFDRMTIRFYHSEGVMRTVAAIREEMREQKT